MEGFASPVSKLGESGLGVAAAPTGGMGMALTEDGKLPPGVLFTDVSGRRMEFGTAVVVYPGGSEAATTLVKTHTLGVTPVVVIATVNTAGPYAAVQIGTLTSTTFTVAVHTTDGTSPVATTAQTVYWLAIG